MCTHSYNKHIYSTWGCMCVCGAWADRSLGCGTCATSHYFAVFKDWQMLPHPHPHCGMLLLPLLLLLHSLLPFFSHFTPLPPSPSLTWQANIIAYVRSKHKWQQKAAKKFADALWRLQVPGQSVPVCMCFPLCESVCVCCVRQMSICWAFTRDTDHFIWFSFNATN